MLADPAAIAADLPFPPSRAPSAGDRLRAELSELARGKARFASHQERGWASVTFVGARHRLELLFEGTAGVEAGERFVDSLPDHEFDIPGQIVVDAAVKEIDHALLPAPRLAISIELLLLEEA